MGIIWSMSQALIFIRDLENSLNDKYHVGLTGSVLYDEVSYKDLDIIIMPHSTDEANINNIYYKLNQFGLIQTQSKEVVAARHYKDEKHVEVWDYKGKRVDIFFMNFPKEVVTEPVKPLPKVCRPNASWA